MRKNLAKKGCLFLIAGLLLYTASAYAGVAEVKLSQLSLGMKPEEIISKLGEPDLIRSEGVNTAGKTVQTMQYNVTKRIDLSKEEVDTGAREMTYVCSLMIVDGVLVRVDRQR